MRFFKNGLITILISKILMSCIPIQDDLFPVIEEFRLENEVNYYGDTLTLSIAATDNFLLDSGFIKIRKAFPLPTDQNRWELDSMVELAGRKYRRILDFPIPTYIDTGLYYLEAATIDAQNNRSTDTLFFQLNSDNKRPRFNQVKLSDLDLVVNGSDTSYWVCRSEIVMLEGILSDNLQLTKIGFSWGDQLPQFTRISTDSINLEQFFSNGLKVPSNIPNGTLTELNLIAVDTFEFVKIYQIPITVACDDTPPQFFLGKTFPRVSANGFVSILQGQSLLVESLKVYDNQFLEGVKIYEGIDGGELQEIKSFTFNTVDTVELKDHSNLDYQVPASAPVGQIRYLVFKAVDSVFSYETAPENRLTIYVEEDKFPNMIITDQYVEGQSTSFSYTDPLGVAASDRITFEGKIEEQIGLTNLEFYWYDEAEILPSPLYSFTNLNQFPLNLGDFHNFSTFQIPASAVVGTIYVLKIHAEDLKGQVVENTYRFVVE